MPAPPSELDQQAQDALDKTKLELLVAEPALIPPFTSSTLRWKVTVPTELDVTVELKLGGAPIPTSGQLTVAPQETQSYQLTAEARRYSRFLGMVTVEVDLRRCIIHSDDSFVFAITQVIRQQIATNTHGLYFPTPPAWLPDAGGSLLPPPVQIVGDRMVITLRLAVHSNHWYAPDPSVDIDASFALDVGPIPNAGPGAVLSGLTPSVYQRHELVPSNEVVNTNVSFPLWTWAVPGAQLPIAFGEDDAQGKSKRTGTDMINGIVAALNDWFIYQQDLQPAQAWDKHDAGFYVNPEGDQRFWITFCPAPQPMDVPA